MADTVQQLHSPAFLRLRQILGDPKATPPIPPIIPISKSAFWSGIATGKYPRGIKLGPKTTVWRASEIYALVEQA